MGYAWFVAEVAHGVYLVFHQGYERRNNYGCSFHQQGGELIAEAFAAAGGQEYECVVAGQEIGYDFFLVAFELVKSEILLECLGYLFFVCHSLL